MKVLNEHTSSSYIYIYNILIYILPRCCKKFLDRSTIK